MEAFKERLIQEYVELDERQVKLQELRQECDVIQRKRQSPR